MSIRSYFSNLSKKHNEYKVYRAKVDVLVDAIRHENLPLVNTLFADVKSDALYTRGTEAALISAAIRQDNTEVFSAVFGDRNPNYFFESYTYSDPRVPAVIQREHVLHAAINAGSENVALMFAKDPRVDVTDPGSFTVALWNAKATPLVSDLELAQQRGLEKVSAVIAAKAPRA